MGAATMHTTTAILTRDTPVKFLTDDGIGRHSGSPWPMPGGDAPGRWVEVRGVLVPCERGLHYTTIRHWRMWQDDRCFLIEQEGGHVVENSRGLARYWDQRLAPTIQLDDKWVTSRARLVSEVTAWNGRNLRLFAADCAERVLPLFERDHPGDTGPREAIEVARRYALGEANAGQLGSAYDEARTSYWTPASTAAKAAAAPSALSASRGAARAARVAAAESVGVGKREDAANDEVAWQDARLLAYLNGEA